MYCGKNTQKKEVTLRKGREMKQLLQLNSRIKWRVFVLLKLEPREHVLYKQKWLRRVEKMNDAGKRGNNSRSKILTKTRVSRTLFTRTIRTIRKQSLLKYTKVRERACNLKNCNKSKVWSNWCLEGSGHWICAYTALSLRKVLNLT